MCAFLLRHVVSEIRPRLKAIHSSVMYHAYLPHAGWMEKHWVYQHETSTHERGDTTDSSSPRPQNDGSRGENPCWLGRSYLTRRHLDDLTHLGLSPP